MPIAMALTPDALEFAPNATAPSALDAEKAPIAMASVADTETSLPMAID